MTEDRSDGDRSTERRTADRTGALTDAERRKRRAKVFGDVLPETTRDDAQDGWGEPAADTESAEDWLRRQVPPHHG